MNTIDIPFDWFLSATLRGSLLALAVILVQTALGSRLPAVWRHALWLPVLFVLGSPVLPESPLSLDRTWAREGLPPIQVEVDPVVTPVGAAVPAPEATFIRPPIHWSSLTGWIWLTGAISVLLTGIIACRRTLARFRRGSRPLTDGLRAEIIEAASACGLRRVPRVLVSHDVPGPAMTGLVRPLLLLPDSIEEAFDREDRRLILLHEFTHVKRGDLITNGLVFLLQALHWCNPIVWFAFHRFRADRELACDSAVLAACPEEGRSRYGHALLKVEGAVGPASWRLGFIGLVGLFGRGRILHSRIAAIAGHRRSHPLWNLAGTGLLLTMILTGATRAQNEPSPEGGPQIVIETKFIEVPIEAKIEIVSNRATLDQKNSTMVFSADSKVEETLAATPGADILSAPSVVTLSGQKATIEVGQEVQDSEGHPRHVGARVEILPTLNDGEIHLAIHARNTRVIPATADKPQSFAEREIRTQISVKPGDTLVVDTLEQDQDPDTARRLLFTARARLSDGGDAERARLEKIIIPQIEFNDVGLSDALAFLRTKAREHDSEKKGVNLIYKPRAETPEPRLTVSFKEIPLTEALKYFAQLAALDLEFSEAAVVLDERSARMTGSPTSQPKGMSQDLASRLILPQVEFKEASLPKILQFLQQKSLELDPEKKGLNLILNAPGDPSPETIQISLHLREVPLSEALRYVAKLANLNLRYDDDAVVLFRD